MRNLLLIGAIFCSGLVFAQDVEERNEQMLENSNNINFIDVKMPFYQLVVKGCDHLKPAEFEGGAYTFKKLLTNFMYDYLNTDMYKLNGDFTFIITIDEKGNIIQSEGSPKIQNSHYFFDDMQYIFRRIKQKWTPAKCQEIPTTSQVKININFSSMAIEI
ncbi:MAG: hypothetical protein JSS94_04015 [Bacteroidetes bacterium]|nr:hypothetical protein [Bacteroidota bacterium]